MHTNIFPRTAVLASGSGTLLEAKIRDNLPITMVMADRPCRALDIATAHGIPSCLIPRRGRFKLDLGVDSERERFTIDVVNALGQMSIELVVMAGYMTVFSPYMFDVFENRVLNIHPSLLPAFKGETAVKDAHEFGVKITGSTVHIATAKLDEGPILEQVAVPVLPDDTVDSLWERIKIEERKMYPAAVRRYAQTLPETTMNVYEKMGKYQNKNGVR